MRIAVGSDERTALTDQVVDYLKRRELDIQLHGALRDGDQSLWPYVGRQVAEAVASGHCQEGVLFCWTGTGVCMAANKVPGIRAALCTDTATAAGARRWNHANVLVMSLRLTSPALAQEMLDAWLLTPFGQGEDAECVAILKEIDQAYRHSAHAKASTERPMPV